MHISTDVAPDPLSTDIMEILPVTSMGSGSGPFIILYGHADGLMTVFSHVDSSLVFLYFELKL